MRFMLLLSIALLFFGACTPENKPDQTETISNAHDSLGGAIDAPKPTGDPRLDRPRPKLVFNLKSFIGSADSLVTILSGQDVHFRYVITNKLDTTKGNFTVLRPSQSQKIQHYRLLANKGDGKWDIGIVRMEYKSAKDLENAYEALSKKITSSHSATNNYGAKFSDQLVWVYTGCSYSEARMRDMKEILLRDLNTGDASKSIFCACKKGACELTMTGGPIE